MQGSRAVVLGVGCGLGSVRTGQVLQMLGLEGGYQSFLTMVPHRCGWTNLRCCMQRVVPCHARPSAETAGTVRVSMWLCLWRMGGTWPCLSTGLTKARTPHVQPSAKHALRAVVDRL